MDDDLSNAIDDPTLRAWMNVARREFEGHARGTSVVINGALNVLRVDTGSEQSASAAGFALTEALNEALDQASDALQRQFAADVTIPAELRALAEDGAKLSSDVSPTVAAGDFQGSAADGRVVVHVSGRTRRISSVYIEKLTEDLIAAVPAAANRALAAAELGQDGAVPLDEQIDATLEQLDKKMTRIEERLGTVDDQLDAILRNLS